MINIISKIIGSHPINQLFNLGGKQAVWKKVKELKPGVKIAIENKGQLDWDEVVSIKKVGREEVYDIEVEGTHNFIGNGIVAHNTYISGNVGIGVTTPTAKLSIGGSNSTISNSSGNITITPASDLIISQGNVGIGTTTPLSKLGLLGNLSVGATYGAVAAPTSGLIVEGNVGIGVTTPLSKLGLLGNLSVGATYGAVAAPTSGLIVEGNVGIGTTAPTTSSLLDLASTSKGFLAPRMNTTQRDAISTPATGLMIYNTSTNQYNVYNGSSWGAMGGGISGTGTATFVPKWTNTTTLGDSAIFDSSGNIGIGTTVPLSKFGVLGNTSIGATYGAVAAPTSGLIVEGNVGIGTTNPTSPLHVSQPGSTNTNSTFASNTPSVQISSPDYSESSIRIGDVGSGYGRISHPMRDVGGAAYLPRLAFGDDVLNTGEYLTILLSGTSVGTAGDIGIGTAKPLSKLGVLGNTSIGDTYGAVAAPTSGLIVEGNVGIGTTSPANKLDVNGTVQATGFKLTTSPNNGYVLTSDASGVGTWQAASAGVTGTGTTNYIPKWTNTSVLGNSAIFDSSSNVGIGTTAPLSKLGVLGNTSIGATYGAVAAPTSGLIVEGNVGIGTTTPLATFDVNGTGVFGMGLVGTPSIAFRTDLDTGMWSSAGNTINFSTTGTERLRIVSNGNIGIGTTAPANKLDVNGTIQMTGIKMTTSPASGYVLTSDVDGVGTWTDVSSTAGPWTLAGSNVYTDSASYNVGIGTTAPLSKLGVLGNTSIGATYGAIAAPTSGAIIEGNVGIGTTNPGYNLEVNGTFRANTTTPVFGTHTLTVPATGTVALGTGSGGYAAYWSTTNTLTAEQYLSVSRGGSGAGTFTKGILASPGGSSTFTTIAGTDNYIPKWSSSYPTTVSSLYDNGNVGIGTTAPLSKLGLLGNLSVGATYGNVAAPTSGAIIEGDVGIGTTAPAAVDQYTAVVKSAVLPSERAGVSCAENSSTHKIYCFGGDESGGALSQITEYNPGTDTLSTMTATLPTARAGVSCAENSSTHKIYCFGGTDSLGQLSQIIEYNPATDALSTMTATLPTARADLSCAENSSTNKIYCFGGDQGGSALSQIIEYNPATDALSTMTATLPAASEYLSCTENSSTHKIYCFGGYNSVSEISTITEYNPATDALSTMTATLPTGRDGLSCSENSSTNKIYCFGGWQDGSPDFLSTITEYNPATDALSTITATLPSPRSYFSCEENSSTNKIYCFGGYGNSGNRISQIVEFTHSTITNKLEIAGTTQLRGAAGLTGLYVGSDGNVGINTTNPTAKLDIDGTFNVNQATELITNGTFTGSATGWTLSDSATYNAGTNDVTVNFVTGNTGAGLYTSFNVTAGKSYKVTYTLSAISGDEVYAALDNNNDDSWAYSHASNGTYTEYFGSDYSGTETIYFENYNWNTGSSWTIDNVSIKEISSPAIKVTAYNGETVLSLGGDAAGNTAIGLSALTSNYSYENTAMGAYSLFSNTYGHDNTAEGYRSLYSNTYGYNNSSFGSFSLINNNSGHANTAMGYESLYSNYSGDHNTSVGNYALGSNYSGDFNTALGDEAGNNAAGSYSLFLGASTYPLSSSDTNEIVIGYGATGLGSDSVILGNDSITKTALRGNVGIGTTNPSNKLEVVGDALIQDIKITAGNIYSGNNSLLLIGGGSQSTRSNINIVNNGGIELNADSGSAQDITLDVRGGGKILLKNGNVGIGTTAPLSKLGVLGNTSIGATYGAIAAPTSGLIVEGNVGIGLTTPGVKLDVNGSARADIFYDTVGTNAYYLDPAQGGTSLSIAGNIISSAAVPYIKGYDGANYNTLVLVGSSSSTTTSLCVSYNGEGTSCSGKIDAGTIDPPYTINGKKYATYLSAMTGVKEETTGTVNTNEYVPGVGYRSVINFNNLTEGSDLWLFSKTTNLKKNIENLIPLLTPQDNARTWYSVDKDFQTLTIYSSSPTTVAYRLTAPRFDNELWANTRDSSGTGFIINNPDNISFNVSPNGDVIVPTIKSDQEYVYDGNLNIETQASKISKIIYSVQFNTGKIVQEVGQFSEIIAANIKTGLINAQNIIINNTLIAKNIISENLSSKKITSPIIETENIVATGSAAINTIATNEIKAKDNKDITVSLSDDFTADNNETTRQSGGGQLAKLVIKGLEGKTVAAIDGAGNASFSGQIIADSLQIDSNATISGNLASNTLTANDASVSGTLAAKEIKSENIDSLTSGLANTQTNINDIQKLLADIKNQPTVNTAEQTNLSSTTNLEELTVTGNTNLYNVSISNSLLVGTTFIENNSIVSLASELKLNALNKITLFDGAVTIAKDGTMTTKGELIAQAGIRTDEIRGLTDTDQVKINNLVTDKLSISDKYLEATTSASIIAAADNFDKNGIFAPAIETATTSAGIGILPDNSNEIIIYNNNLKKDSLIYLTPTSSSASVASLTVGQKETCESTSVGCKSYFKVITSTTSASPVKFNWLIIN